MMKSPELKLKTIANPFGDWCNSPKLVLVPAINPDVTIIHVQQADCRGNARIQGLTFADVEQAKAARHLIITCEELVEENFLKRDPDYNQIPFIHVDAVVPIAWGAYPTACYRHYDYDPKYLNHYRRVAEDEKSHQAYLTEKIMRPGNHQEFLALCDQKYLQTLLADPETGYATGLERN